MFESLLSSTLYNRSAGLKVVCDAKHGLTLKMRRQCKLACRLMTYTGWGDFVSISVAS